MGVEAESELRIVFSFIFVEYSSFLVSSGRNSSYYSREGTCIFNTFWIFLMFFVKTQNELIMGTRIQIILLLHIVNTRESSL